MTTALTPTTSPAEDTKLEEIRAQAPLASVISALPDFSQLSSVPESSEDAGTFDITYSRLLRFWGSATRELARELTHSYDSMDIDSDDDVIELICYLIDDKDIRTVPDWMYASQSEGGGVSITRSKRNNRVITSARWKYEELLESLASDGGFSWAALAGTTAIIPHVCEEAYPQVMEDEATERAGFDTDEYLNEEG